MFCPLISVVIPPLILVHVEAPYIFVQFFYGKSGLQPRVCHHFDFKISILNLIDLRPEFKFILNSRAMLSFPSNR